MADDRPHASWAQFGLTILLTILSVVATLAWAQGADSNNRLQMRESVNGLASEVKHLAESVSALSMNTAAINAQVLEHLHAVDYRLEQLERK